jgi:hypothetical protein
MARKEGVQYTEEVAPLKVVTIEEDGENIGWEFQVDPHKNPDIIEPELDEYGIKIRFDEEGNREYPDRKFGEMLNWKEMNLLNQTGEIKHAIWAMTI